MAARAWSDRPLPRAAGNGCTGQAALAGRGGLPDGRDRAALASAIVSTKADGHFSRSAVEYFAEMVCKDERDELHLERSFLKTRHRA
jgi:hypothetical protein